MDIYSKKKILLFSPSCIGKTYFINYLNKNNSFHNYFKNYLDIKEKDIIYEKVNSNFGQCECNNIGYSSQKSNVLPSKILKKDGTSELNLFLLDSESKTEYVITEFDLSHASSDRIESYIRKCYEENQNIIILSLYTNYEDYKKRVNIRKNRKCDRHPIQSVGDYENCCDDDLGNKICYIWKNFFTAIEQTKDLKIKKFMVYSENNKFTIKDFIKEKILNTNCKTVNNSENIKYKILFGVLFSGLLFRYIFKSIDFKKYEYIKKFNKIEVNNCIK